MDDIPLVTRLAGRCNSDGEFVLAARYWDGGLRLSIGADALAFTIVGGEIMPAAGDAGARSGRIALSGPIGVWDKLLAPTPPPMFNDIMPAVAGGLVIESDGEILWQYYPAVRRLIDLLREEVNRDGTV